MAGRVDSEMVSIIISAYNYESYLADAIKSSLDQDWEPLEVIVVDDGSTDNTLAVARRFGSQVRIVEGFHEGAAATRNRGIAAAHGAFFLHLDADDVLRPAAVRTLMGVFEREKRCDIAAGNFACFASPELSIEVTSRFRVPSEPQRGHLAGVAICRAGVFTTVGVLDEKYQPASDVEWWLRATAGDITIELIDSVVLNRRIHGNNSSLRASQAFRDVSLRLVREALQRKRMVTE